MLEAKKLGAFLLQMTPAFSPRAHGLEELDLLRDRLAEHLLAVELRNRNWVAGEQLGRTLEYFRTRKISLVLVDAPESEHFTVMPGLNCVTNPELAYFRLHGRNEEGYIKGRTVADRFDHDYSEAELREIMDRLLAIEPEIKRLHLAANNNRANYAPKAALRIKSLMEARDDLREKLAAVKNTRGSQQNLL